MSHQATIATKNAVIFQVEAVTATADSMDLVQAASFSRQRDDQLEWFQQMRALPLTYTKTGGVLLAPLLSSPLHWNACHAINAWENTAGCPAAPTAACLSAAIGRRPDGTSRARLVPPNFGRNPPRGLARSDQIFGFRSGQF